MVKSPSINIKAINVMDVEHIMVVVEVMVVIGGGVFIDLVLDGKVMVKVKAKFKEETIKVYNVNFVKILVIFKFIVEIKRKSKINSLEVKEYNNLFLT